MLYASLAIVIGLILLVWSADKFVEGAASSARHFGMSPLLIGIVIVGFGTSAPEMLVSASSALKGASGIALGNAYGSNITNIALILGVTALIKPIIVASEVIKKELPMLILITLVSAYMLFDAQVTQIEAVILLIIFAVYMGWTIWVALRSKNDTLAQTESLNEERLPIGKALFWVVIGLLFLMVSSQLLVWGAVEIAKYFGVSDLVIGLTIVAVGTSLPELASSIIAARKGESDLALGNIVGSNLFNTLAVVGIAGAIEPMQVEAEVFSRDMLVMLAVTVLLFFFAFSFRKRAGRINRAEGAILFICYVAYTLYLLKTAV
ncbi:calcium/sodium antiporter [Actinobacillus pleuropneumoniae]|uniref:Calcium/sodium antiporter n=1 Tax=Actinobacillus pleuropneumoniae TaxID=715 RepID=A0A9Q4DJC2_ACTPL|nr:calcium/sodium antiporter [Actinobacillus pleuropneumoniae]MCL7720753.1 calcium/sodium antiporter [Actinobacillus pleuropneumoniae]MCL7726770.1 calcium/sodium antiporter [Actinobacillus pleuropneumoniae]MCL7729274.1 calcium/sodium antiporter [Actinobacillus pleuropneumoniae]MCY6368279.1 calcium/sodium antiporter [Actinobacillus pleuropneumoniae]MCY6385148.1 calcium/sodium antiporter [Actinobacillus pleuropneumoniae]